MLLIATSLLRARDMTLALLCIQVLGYNMALTGNGAKAVIYADGTETSSERRGADPSRAGNQLSGTFTLTLRGWETQVCIEFSDNTAEQLCASGASHTYLFGPNVEKEKIN